MSAPALIDRRFAVMVETHEGTTHVLRYFATREEANSHPVTLKQWKRAWVIRIVPTRLSPRDYFPPFPWTVKWSDDGRVTYLQDGEGHTIATLLGTRPRRLKMQEYLEALR